MKVSIIGAGMSGLTAGCYLQQNGFETEIFEKHAIPGGLCTSWHKNGYTIDGCIHWILGSDEGSSFNKMWTEILDMKKIEFVNHDIRIEVEVKNTKDRHGSNVFKLYTNLDQLHKYLLDLSPEDKKPIDELIKSMRIMQKFDLPPVMDELPFFQSMIRGIKMTRYLEFLYWFLKLKNETNYTFAKKLKSPFLRESFELLYDGNEVNILVVTMPLSCFDKKSAGYPVGGSLEFAKKVEQSYLELGGKIHYKTPVKKILVEGDTAKGLLVRNDVKHYSDIILSASDWHFTVFDLLDGKFTNNHMLELRDLKKLEVFYSVVHLGFGINADLKDQPHFSRYPLKEDLILPDGTKYDRLEVHVYNYDRTMAPPGKSAVVVSFYTKNGDWWLDLRKNNRPEYRKVKKEFTEKIIDLLDERLGGIKDKLEMSDMATPATVYRYTNNWKGSTQGWLPGKYLLAPSPVGFLLPGLKNFYFSSHWNQPGGGLPIAIKTGRDVTKAICKATGKKFITIKKV
ncbi:MAG: NAD(P)/FAD-dependent oxidoreductase [Sphingobacteriaceae bacterium]|nr:NAD(P)/FAD-dependent oxidoreductase [Sphingobacteriaceae bacterium]